MAINNIDIQDDKGNSYRPMANPDSITDFTKAGSRVNIASGDSFRTVWGKICKFFEDLGTSAFSGLANNLTTTASGYGMDARQGPVIQQKFNEINSNLASLNDSGAIKGMDAREDGVYITYSNGADTVVKKLGSDTLFPKIMIQPNAGQGTFDTYTLDVSEKSTLSIESMQSWYDNAGVSIVADGTVNLYSKSHQTGGANRVDTSAIGKFDVSAYSTITITFSAAATNPDARGWATLNNISIS